MRRFLRRFNSLRAALLFVVLMCWLAPTLLLGGYLGTRFFSSMQDKTEAALMNGAEHAQVLTLENINKVITLAKDLTYDGELASAVAAYESGRESYEVYYRICRNYLERKYGRDTLCSFALFFREKEPQTVFFTTDDYPASVFFYTDVQPQVLKLSETLDTKCLFYTQGGQTYLIRNLYNLHMEKYGMLVLGVNMDALLAPVLAEHTVWESSFSLKLDNYTTGDWLDAPAGLSEQNGLLLYTLSAASRDYDFHYQVQTDKHTVYQEMETFRGLMWFMLLLMLPVGAAFMTFVGRRIIHPIELLNDAATRIQGGELGLTVPMRGQDELGQLGRVFSSMSMQLKTLIDKSYKEEIALRDAKIQAMQSRINPHFINNALETINWQARMEQSDTISAMVEALSVLLNASMDRGERHIVPLKEELEIADAYFYFIKLRFGDRLTIRRDVDERLLTRSVPCLAIQTLLENAVEHGVAPAGGGCIQLNIYARDELLYIEVINNGQRLTDADAARIARLLEEEAPSGEHLGLRNIKERLRLLYGDRAGLTLTRDARGDTLCRLCLLTDEELHKN